MMIPARRIKVLVVDDSALVRSVLMEGLNRYPYIQVVGSAPDPIAAEEKIRIYTPDVLTLDIQMPKMDGLTFLKKIMAEQPMPIIMVSSHTRNGCEVTLDCLEAGAFDFVAKPSTGGAKSLDEMIDTLAEKIRFASRAHVHRPMQVSAIEKPRVPRTYRPGATQFQNADRILVIGASTGGPEALRELLIQMPKSIPPILVVQHMPENFTYSFAQRLNAHADIEVREAKSGDTLHPGLALIAPGNYHLLLCKQGREYYVETQQTAPCNGHRPSVDILFESVARCAGSHAIGVLLTGMGKDGAQGLLSMRNQGAYTIAQDERSSVVFGMPKEAIAMRAVEKVASLQQIPEEILQSLQNSAVS